MEHISSLARLRANWPQVYRALQETYHPEASFGATYHGSMNDAGYMLAGLEQFRQLWDSRHAQRQTPHSSLDAGAAREIRYHFKNGRTFNRPVAALSTAICRLVVERPEKIWQTPRNTGGKNAGQTANRGEMPESDRRRHHTMSPDLSLLQNRIGATGAFGADRRPGATGTSAAPRQVQPRPTEGAGPGEKNHGVSHTELAR